MENNNQLLDINSLKLKADLAIADLIALEEAKDSKSLKQQMTVLSNLFGVAFTDLIRLPYNSIEKLVGKVGDGIKELNPNVD